MFIVNPSMTLTLGSWQVGEGGSGGALGLCMGNEIAMLSGGYFGVISPEGAASILGRYRDDKVSGSQYCFCAQTHFL